MKRSRIRIGARKRRRCRELAPQGLVSGATSDSVAGAALLELPGGGISAFRKYRPARINEIMMTAIITKIDSMILNPDIFDFFTTCVNLIFILTL